MAVLFLSFSMLHCKFLAINRCSSHLHHLHRLEFHHQLFTSCHCLIYHHLWVMTATSWMLLLVLVYSSDWWTDALVSAESLIRFWIFSIYFFSPLNVNWDGISSSPWARSLENWRVSVIVHLTVPRFCKNNEQVPKLFLGTWLIISLSLTTDIMTKG